MNKLISFVSLVYFGHMYLFNNMSCKVKTNLLVKRTSNYIAEITQKNWRSA